MLGRRGAARRNRQFRDRGDTINTPAYHPHQYFTNTHASNAIYSSPSAPDPIAHSLQHSSYPAITFKWPDPEGRRPNAVLVASFDNHLHHTMYVRPHENDLSVTLHVPPGQHTYKFLVDGVWSTHQALHNLHPIQSSPDGVRYHSLIVDHISYQHHQPQPLPDSSIQFEQHHNETLPNGAVFRSVSATTPVNSLQNQPRPSLPHQANTYSASNKMLAATNAAGADTRNRLHHHHHMSPRGSSFNTAPGSTASTSALNNISTSSAQNPCNNTTSSNISNATAASTTAVDQRKSLLRRVGSGWRRRFSHRAAAAAACMDNGSGISGGGYASSGYGSPAHSMSRCNFQAAANGTFGLDRSGSGIFGGGGGGLGIGRNGHDHGRDSNNSGRHYASLFPSSSEPAVSRISGSGVKDGNLIDKENMSNLYNNNVHNNNNGNNKRGHGLSMTPDRRRNHHGAGANSVSSGGGLTGSLSGSGLRGSNRSQGGVKISVSMPTRVDEPRDEEEVNKQSDNWRQMARHLTDNLRDPSAARELLVKAVEHREKHGLSISISNAHVHTDLARNLSKADQTTQAETHLRIALDIHSQLSKGGNNEQCADLKLYIGVMVDRQKRRTEAETLYRQALDMYKLQSFEKCNKNNKNIAKKNLVLNLKKQNRGHDEVSVYEEYGPIDD